MWHNNANNNPQHLPWSLSASGPPAVWGPSYYIHWKMSNSTDCITFHQTEEYDCEMQSDQTRWIIHTLSTGVLWSCEAEPTPREMWEKNCLMSRTSLAADTLVAWKVKCIYIHPHKHEGWYRSQSECPPLVRKHEACIVWGARWSHLWHIKLSSGVFHWLCRLKTDFVFACM